MALRTFYSLIVVATAVAIFSPPLPGQQPPPNAGPEELPVPPLGPPLVPPAPPSVAPPSVGLPSAPTPLRLQRPMVIQRADSHQKALVYHKVGHLPSYRVTYHDHHRLRRTCCPPTRMIVAIPDPLRPGCVAEICVTAPGCCKGHPLVADSPGPLGRGVVTLAWPNGHRVRVVFKKLVPHVLVHTYPA